MHTVHPVRSGSLQTEESGRCVDNREHVQDCSGMNSDRRSQQGPDET